MVTVDERSHCLCQRIAVAEGRSLNPDTTEIVMEYLDIAGLAPRASRVGLGTWAMGGWMWGGSDELGAVKTIHAALDRGITLIDTAPVYGFGRSEEIVGRALAMGAKRKNALIATKAGLGWSEQSPFRDSRPEQIRKEIEGSLRRLQTDYIDIYQIHWPDPLVPVAETAGVMLELLREGKIRAIGVSNYDPEQMDAFRQVAPIHTVQPPYNLFERGIETDILPYAKQHGIAVLAYGALCRGLLSGKIKGNTAFGGDDLRKTDPKFQEPRLGAYLAAVGALDRFADLRYRKHALALAVRWILDQGDTIALWGARRPDQLDPVDEAMGWSLDPDAMRRIDRIVADHVANPIGPEFMAPPARSQRKAVA
jgi:aryl-alcohol dehydrogenase-like predicted oxidoreductase